MKKNYIKNNQEGFSMVEIMVAIMLIVFALVGLSTFNLFSIYAANQTRRASLSDHLAVETMEAVRSFRNSRDWDVDGIGALTTGASYYPVLLSDSASSSWDMVPGVEKSGEYERFVEFNPVSRATSTDSIHEIYDATYDDPKTREVTVNVTWSSGTTTIVSYITSWFQ